jgi:S1-C subfamily serine protease
VLIQGVEPNSPAAETGLSSGDVIISANNQPVNSPLGRGKRLGRGAETEEADPAARQA